MEFENLIQLIQTVSDSSLTGFEYEENGIKLNLKKEKMQIQTGGAVVTVPTEILTNMPMQTANIQPVNAASAEVNVTEAASEKEGRLIKSPLVGTFYAAPAEDAAPFVASGDTVKKGQVIAIVEAMKLMNDIESEFDGTIDEVLVENGEIVEYGQPLFRIV